LIAPAVDSSIFTLLITNAAREGEQPRRVAISLG
jgi:hypothetical protein